MVRTSSLISVVAIALFGTGIAVAAPFHGVPDGDFENITSPTLQHTIDGAGKWDFFRSVSGSESVSLVSSNGNTYAALTQQWYPSRSAQLWYTDIVGTSADEAWIVSADLALTMQQGSKDSQALFRVFEGDNGKGTQLSLAFGNNLLTWNAGAESGTIAMATLTASFKTASFTYDPLTGKAAGVFDGQTIFDTTITAGLTFKTISFYNGSPTSWGPSTFAVDNVTAAVVPEPATLGVLSLSLAGLLLSRKR